MSVELRKDNSIVIVHDTDNGSMFRLRIVNVKIPELAMGELEMLTLHDGSAITHISHDDLMRLRHFFTVASANIERVLAGEESG